ncbi:MAG: NrfD/PsrC family molybdoenzyme membrane anchor subunit [Candidatus Kariarchaeaceae archaeon]|jgi:molybdopterin-containing oxidoreductase family membrane subunit
MAENTETMEQKLLNPILNTSKSYYAVVSIFVIIGLFGLVGWIYQLIEGLGVTGLTHRIFWGLYISNFIFFIGISYSGTLISAVLRLTGAEWRTPLTRMAETITVIGIAVGFTYILFDMGRPERVYILPFATRLQSPLFWDFLSVSTYLTGSLIYFYLPLIPDAAYLRDVFAKKQGFDPRKQLYRILAVGWKGTEKQKHALERSISFMSIILIPVAVMCHTVIAFIFAVTWRVGWHSTIFGPYFVVAAIFSGTAAIIVAMTILRKIYKLEEFITYRHYRNMGYVLILLLGTYFYFTITEYFTTIYRGISHDMELMEEMFFGSYAFYFWFFIIGGMIIPAIILLISTMRYESEKAVWGIFTASSLVVIGMWVKRYIIIIPALARPFVAQEWTIYKPTWVEWAITLGGVATFVLAFCLLAKLFPLISIWELKEEAEKKELKRISTILQTGKLE